MKAIAKTPEPPYYTVIFTSQRSDAVDGYEKTAERMVELATEIDGFLGVESVRNSDGLGITVSYWRDEDAIARWRRDTEHRIAQQTGKAIWYDDYFIRVARVERAYNKRGLK